MNLNLAFYGTVIVFLATSSFCSSAEFTKIERSQVVQAIDNICADSWCEGNYNYKFIDFVCNKGDESCDLIFQFISVDNEVEKISAPQFCHFLNIEKMEQVLDVNKNLNMDFYDSLNSCISNLEDEFDKTIHFNL